MSKTTAKSFRKWSLRFDTAFLSRLFLSFVFVTVASSSSCSYLVAVLVLVCLDKH